MGANSEWGVSFGEEAFISWPFLSFLWLLRWGSFCYRGPGKLAQWQIQLGSDFDGDDVVFQSHALTQPEQVTVNASHGTFIGSLAGAEKLAHGQTYYARVQQQSTAGATSDWSRWLQGFVVVDDA